MYQLLNQLTDKGQYAFSGSPILSQRITLHLSDKQISAILMDVREFVKDQPRDYILTFHNAETNEKVYCIDHLPIDDLDQLKTQSDIDSSKIEALNYFSILMDNEFPF